jgi:KTSC domain
MAVLSFTPASSNVESVEFDDSTDTLTVTFQGGESYQYLNVPASVYRAFQAAPSAGAFVHRQLKGRFQAERA